MRISTFSSFQRILSGLRSNQVRAFQSQEQVSTGRRILRPSDDPAGIDRALALRRQLSEVGRNRHAIARGRDALDLAGSSLQDASALLTDARSLLLQGINGTASPEDRESIATQIDALRDQLLDAANTNLAGLFLFGGTATDAPPFVEDSEGVRYVGTESQQFVRAAPEVDLAITTAGSRVFGPGEPTGVRFEGLTGAAPGATANQGEGTVSLQFRHDATDLGAAAGVGIALVGGGAQDTLLGDNTLVVDATAGTVRLGSGPEFPLPTPGSADAQDFVVRNERGGELHLDLTAFTGVDFTGTVRGEGSVSFGGGPFQSVSFTETDLELKDASGNVVHVDATGVRRAGNEQVSYQGTGTVFDLLAEIADDLRNTDGLDVPALQNRLRLRLNDLDAARDDVLVGISDVGLRSRRLQAADQQRQDVELSLESLLSSVQDADLSQAAFELAQADMALQLAQASGARLLQSTLLNFL